MYQSYMMMQFIDEIRKIQKIKVTDLNKGITTVRTYSRYVSGEFEISINVLMAYLKKINYTIPDFWLYIYNSLHFRNHQNLEFISLINDNNIQAASKLLADIEKNNECEFCEILLPVSIMKLNYLQKKIRKSELLDGIDQVIKFDHLLEADVISNQEFKVLMIYYEFCNSKDKQKILSFLEAIIEEKKEIISLDYQKDRMMLLNILIREILQVETLEETVEAKLKTYFSMILNDLNLISMGEIYQEVIENLVKYFRIKGNASKQKRATFYLVAHKLTNSELEKAKLSDEEISVYRELANSEEILNQTFFEDLRFSL